MKHCIIVKWNETVTDKKAIQLPIKALFNRAVDLDGIHHIRLVENCVDVSNRYDLAIVISMDRDALETWKDCDVHKEWKADYTDKMQAKTIFDFED